MDLVVVAGGARGRGSAAPLGRGVELVGVLLQQVQRLRINAKQIKFVIKRETMHKQEARVCAHVHVQSLRNVLWESCEYRGGCLVFVSFMRLSVSIFQRIYMTTTSEQLDCS